MTSIGITGTYTCAIRNWFHVLFWTLLQSFQDGGTTTVRKKDSGDSLMLLQHLRIGKALQLDKSVYTVTICLLHLTCIVFQVRHMLDIIATATQIIICCN